MRIKDDCVPFDPSERLSIVETDDPLKNVGTRMVFKVAKDVQYQSILGLNVLTIRIDGWSPLTTGFHITKRAAPITGASPLVCHVSMSTNSCAMLRRTPRPGCRAPQCHCS